MSNYKVGDKFIIEIDKIFNQDGETLYRAKGMKSLVFDEYGLNILKQLEAETMKLLRENAELKERMQKDIDYLCDLCNNQHNLDVARADGAEKAWKLALKLRYMDYEDEVECFGLEYDGKEKWIEIMEKYTYAEAATKVAEWEHKKEEICVGDVVECEGHHGVVVGAGEVYVKGFTSDWTPFQWMKQRCTKTGRHIDVEGMMTYIGGDSE